MIVISEKLTVYTPHMMIKHIKNVQTTVYLKNFKAFNGLYE
jgi:hypothetical protein